MGTFEEYDVVRLREGRPGDSLITGATGTVLIVHGAHQAYEVEFCDEGGVTIALLTLEPEDIDLVQRQR